MDVSLASPAPAAAPRKLGGKLALWLMLALVVAMASGLGFWTARNIPMRLGFAPYTPIPVVADVPAFSLTDRSGAAITNEMLKGRIWIANFIFTRCGGTCPAMSANMARIQSSVSKMATVWPPVLLVSFTVDPEWDTPEVLAKYADAYGAEDKRWFFLNGKYEEIQTLARDGFKVGVQQDDSSEIEPIIHSQSSVLVDAKGRIRGYYDGTDLTAVRRLLADIDRVYQER